MTACHAPRGSRPSVYSHVATGAAYGAGDAWVGGDTGGFLAPLVGEAAT